MSNELTPASETFVNIYSERRELHVPWDNSTDFKRNKEREEAPS